MRPRGTDIEVDVMGLVLPIHFDNAGQATVEMLKLKLAQHFLCLWNDVFIYDGDTMLKSDATLNECKRYQAAIANFAAVDVVFDKTGARGGEDCRKELLDMDMVLANLTPRLSDGNNRHWVCRVDGYELGPSDGICKVKGKKVYVTRKSVRPARRTGNVNVTTPYEVFPFPLYEESCIAELRYLTSQMFKIPARELVFDDDDGLVEDDTKRVAECRNLNVSTREIDMFFCVANEERAIGLSERFKKLRVTFFEPVWHCKQKLCRFMDGVRPEQLEFKLWGTVCKDYQLIGSSAIAGYSGVCVNVLVRKQCTYFLRIEDLSRRVVEPPGHYGMTVKELYQQQTGKLIGPGERFRYKGQDVTDKKLQELFPAQLEYDPLEMVRMFLESPRIKITAGKYHHFFPQDEIAGRYVRDVIEMVKGEERIANTVHCELLYLGDPLEPNSSMPEGGTEFYFREAGTVEYQYSFDLPTGERCTVKSAQILTVQKALEQLREKLGHADAVSIKQDGKDLMTQSTLVHGGVYQVVVKDSTDDIQLVLRMNGKEMYDKFFPLPVESREKLAEAAGLQHVSNIALKYQFGDDVMFPIGKGTTVHRVFCDFRSEHVLAYYIGGTRFTVNPDDLVAELKKQCLRKKNQTNYSYNVLTLKFWGRRLENNRSFAELGIPSESVLDLTEEPSISVRVKAPGGLKQYKVGESDTVGDLLFWLADLSNYVLQYKDGKRLDRNLLLKDLLHSTSGKSGSLTLVSLLKPVEIPLETGGTTTRDVNPEQTLGDFLKEYRNRTPGKDNFAFLDRAGKMVPVDKTLGECFLGRPEDRPVLCKLEDSPASPVDQADVRTVNVMILVDKLPLNGTFSIKATETLADLELLIMGKCKAVANMSNSAQRLCFMYVNGDLECQRTLDKSTLVQDLTMDDEDCFLAIRKVGDDMKEDSVESIIETMNSSRRPRGDKPPDDAEAQLTDYRFSVNAPGHPEEIVVQPFAADATILDVKRTFAPRYEAAVEHMVVMFAGRPLADNVPLSRIRLQDKFLTIYINDLSEIVLITAKQFRK